MSKKAKSEETEATAVQSTEDQAPTAPPTETEVIARAAYAKVAEELQWKGDFPAWEAISDVARALYVESVEHVQADNPPRTRFEEVVAEVNG